MGLKFFLRNLFSSELKPDGDPFASGQVAFASQDWYSAVEYLRIAQKSATGPKKDAIEKILSLAMTNRAVEIVNILVGAINKGILSPSNQDDAENIRSIAKHAYDMLWEARSLDLSNSSVQPVIEQMESSFPHISSYPTSDKIAKHDVASADSSTMFGRERQRARRGKRAFWACVAALIAIALGLMYTYDPVGTSNSIAELLLIAFVLMLPGLIQLSIDWFKDLFSFRIYR